MPNFKWNCIIAENDPSESNLLKTMLRAHCYQVKVLAEVTEMAEAISCIEKLEPNLIFCNVLLRDGNAFDMIDQLSGYHGNLIFLSVNESSALRAFRYNAFDYLLKPLSPNSLIDVIERMEIHYFQKGFKGDIVEDTVQEKRFATIILNAAGVQHVVQVTDIIHLEGDGNYSTVHLSSTDKILVSKPLKYFEHVLPAKYFYRVHQSHIVNLLNVKNVQNGDFQLITLNTGATVPLARRKKDTFLNWLARQ